MKKQYLEPATQEQTITLGHMQSHSSGATINKGVELVGSIDDFIHGE